MTSAAGVAAPVAIPPHSRNAFARTDRNGVRSSGGDGHEARHAGPDRTTPVAGRRLPTDHKSSTRFSTLHLTNFGIVA